ncbi:hypothetical protein ACFSHT_03005 [Paraburkholderia silviterrae]|uniref:Uncharacterized protein n=1 Tax=Paraburkholderia silviterrae TaxID=2528715 RepID=A0A4R5M4V5_9BURK|nr:hypothetical protein [Paraburkholderia silviterrae]TDG20899.1 hypothetical protein EYW47_23555 [Paraburkholderia silviterrae]
MSTITGIKQIASRLGTGMGYKATKKVNNQLANHETLLKRLLGNKWSHCPPGKFTPDWLDKLPTRNLLFSLNLDPAGDDDIGAVMPSCVVQRTLAMMSTINDLFAIHSASTPMEFDGSVDLLAPIDVAPKYWSDSQVLILPRTYRNQINSVPVMQQQAALNVALLAYSRLHPESEIAQLANAYGMGVGKRWEDLNSLVFAGPALNTVFSQAGLVHLMGDVPAVVVEEFAPLLTQQKRPLAPEEIIKGIELVGGAAALAASAARGAAKSSREFAISVEKSFSPQYGLTGMQAAKWFLSTEAINGAVEQRDRYVADALYEFLLAQKTNVSHQDIFDSLQRGSKAAAREAKDVEALALATTDQFAEENLELARKRADTSDQLLS